MTTEKISTNVSLKFPLYSVKIRMLQTKFCLSQYTYKNQKV